MGNAFAAEQGSTGLIQCSAGLGSNLFFFHRS